MLGIEGIVFGLIASSASWLAGPQGFTQQSTGNHGQATAICYGEPGVFPAHWISGGPDCGSEPDIQVHAYNDDLFILRQSLCTSFEAPFLYLIFGQSKALLLDTGDGGIPLANTVRFVIQNWLVAHGQSSIDLVVAHLHAHGDHVQGDAELQALPNTIVVPHDVASVQSFFGISSWPDQIATFDLGGRVLDVIPIPGHEPSHIALYDRRTALLFTGDSLYAGRLYVFGASQGNWAVYKSSVQRLVDFTRTRPLCHILGTHIEMTTTPGVQQPFGSTHHPNEHALELGRAHLLLLHHTLQSLPTPQQVVLDEFVIFPIG